MKNAGAETNSMPTLSRTSSCLTPTFPIQTEDCALATSHPTFAGCTSIPSSPFHCCRTIIIDSSDAHVGQHEDSVWTGMLEPDVQVGLVIKASIADSGKWSSACAGECSGTHVMPKRVPGGLPGVGEASRLDSPEALGGELAVRRCSPLKNPRH
jgi:hypothetical protein